MKANYRVQLTKKGVKKPIIWVFENKTYQKVQSIIKGYIESQHHECSYVIEEIK